MSFLWEVAKSRAEAVAGKDRLNIRGGPSIDKKKGEEGPLKRFVVVFVLGGVAPKELEAFEALGAPGGPTMGPFEGPPEGAPERPPASDFLLGSTCITTPARLGAALFGEFIEDLSFG